jgi:hypothetical protein
LLADCTELVQETTTSPWVIRLELNEHYDGWH